MIACTKRAKLRRYQNNDDYDSLSKMQRKFCWSPRLKSIWPKHLHRPKSTWRNTAENSTQGNCSCCHNIEGMPAISFDGFVLVEIGLNPM